MKKKLLALLTVMASTACALAFAACDPAKTPPATEEKFSVVFFGNYPGAGKTTVLVEDGKTVTKIENPTQNGFQFDTWYQDYECTEEFDFTKPITQDTMIFAGWNRSAYVVTYRYNNGSADTSATVPLNQSATEPTNPTRDNYRFTGWYTDPTCESQYQYNFADSVKKDFTLYAGWQLEKATIVFDLSYTGAPEATSQAVTCGEVATKPQDPVRDLYRFTGWKTSRAADAALFSFEEAIGYDKDTIYLYASWERSQYIVTYMPNYGEAKGTEERVNVGGAAESAPITRKGYDFKGWFEDSNTTKAANLTAVSGDTTVYAGWEKHTYTVTFDYNYQGAPASTTQGVKFEELLPLPQDPERTNYNFNDWSTKADTLESFDFGNTPITDDITLYAHWTAAEQQPAEGKVFLTFHNNVTGLDDVYQKVEMDVNTRPKKPTAPNYDDYYFVNWYADAACTKTFSFSSKVTKNTDVYAKLLKRHVFEAEYTNIEGKIGVGSSVNVTEPEGLLMNGSHVTGGASGGYFLRCLYYNGAFLEYEIYSDAEVNDGVLGLRVSSECKPIYESGFVDENGYLSPDAFKVVVNGTYDASGMPLTGVVNFTNLFMPQPNLTEKEDSDNHKTAFSDSIIIKDLHLNKGWNKIRFIVTNSWSYDGGTYAAVAPMFDCMYIYTNANLIMKRYYTWINKLLVQEGKQPLKDDQTYPQ